MHIFGMLELELGAGGYGISTELILNIQNNKQESCAIAKMTARWALYK